MKSGIRFRLLGGFAAVMVLGCLAGIVLLVIFSKTVMDLEHVVGTTDVAATAAVQVEKNLMAMSDDLRGYMLDTSDGSTREQLVEARQQLLDSLKEIEPVSGGQVHDMARQLASMTTERIAPVQGEHPRERMRQLTV